MPARIAAFTYFLPDTAYTNADFAAHFPEARLQSLEKIGVEKRHIAAPGQTSADLAAGAAERLFSEYIIDRSSIDFLIYCSFEHDYFLPTTACILQQRLGLSTRCGAFDMGLGCSAYVYGIATAVSLLETLQLKNVLLLTASTLSRKIHPRDRGNRYLFGDAASATLVSFSEKKQTGPFTFGTDGSGAEMIIVPHGGERHPLNETSFEETTNEYGNVSSPATLHMDGFDVFKFSVATVPGLIDETLQKAGLTKDDIDLYVFHQPNVFLNETLRKKMMIGEDKFVHCMKEFGNTVQATIPIALTESLKNGQLKPGMKVLLAAFGVGLSWSCGIIDYE
jgi:3-oxoacyl-[acyl-carrier-protein] synthase III